LAGGHSGERQLRRAASIQEFLADIKLSFVASELRRVSEGSPVSLLGGGGASVVFYLGN
jgi:hypothetical protein